MLTPPTRKDITGCGGGERLLGTNVPVVTRSKPSDKAGNRAETPQKEAVDRKRVVACVVLIALLLAGFGVLQAMLPLGTAVKLGADVKAAMRDPEPSPVPVCRATTGCYPATPGPGW
jgi:hypothetical protein